MHAFFTGIGINFQKEEKAMSFSIVDTLWVFLAAILVFFMNSDSHR